MHVYLARQRLAGFPQLACAFKAAILDGSLNAGSRLPPTRALAQKPGMSRITVLSAYDQLPAGGCLQGVDGNPPTDRKRQRNESAKAESMRSAARRLISSRRLVLGLDVRRADGAGMVAIQWQYLVEQFVDRQGPSACR
ncbi:hypothetical protein B1991_11345 [Rhodanobacter lindaniclasticus]|uniref:HTH gntR-type domain-containing protein n=1 Tax=Rhodanobacter lindaniclasticus TaxID=75310 RepID=A0A4S3KEJ2_9GAMM|nr:hypothetical protein B1991_11345 [Rhodanobacter lindaniclasticus]